MSDAEFDRALSDALGTIPEHLKSAMTNVVIMVAEEPEGHEYPDLLGLYEGVPLTERHEGDGDWMLPDSITLYSGPLQRIASTRDELVEQIAITIVHEIAHHFGIGDDRLEELGWD